MPVASKLSPPLARSYFMPRYWPTWLGLALLRLVILLPRSAQVRLGHSLGNLIFSRNAKRRAIAATNLALCFPQLSAKELGGLLKSHFYAMGLATLDYGTLWWASPQKLAQMVKIKGLEYCHSAKLQGKNLILLTGHYVGIDICGITLSRHLTMLAFMKSFKNPLINGLMVKQRKRHGGSVFYRDQGLRPVIKAIKNGGALLYLPDQDFGPEQSVFVPFFATQSASITTLGRMASLCNAVVIPCAVRYDAETQGYEVVLRAPLADFPTGDDYQDTLSMTQALEQDIAQAPEQYMWTLKLFRSRPDGQPSPYES